MTPELSSIVSKLHLSRQLAVAVESENTGGGSLSSVEVWTCIVLWLRLKLSWLRQYYCCCKFSDVPFPYFWYFAVGEAKRGTGFHSFRFHSCRMETGLRGAPLGSDQRDLRKGSARDIGARAC